MNDEDWNAPFSRALGLRMVGHAMLETDARGNPVVDDVFYWILNAHYEPLAFVLPEVPEGDAWKLLLDTREAALPSEDSFFEGGSSYEMVARSTALLVLPRKKEESPPV